MTSRDSRAAALNGPTILSSVAIAGRTAVTGGGGQNDPNPNLELLPPAGSAYLAVMSGGTLSIQSGAQLSLQTFSFSILTAASATAIPSGNLGLVFRASGLSLVYNSGGTVYSLASSTVSGVA